MLDVDVFADGVALPALTALWQTYTKRDLMNSNNEISPGAEAPVTTLKVASEASVFIRHANILTVTEADILFVSQF